MDDIEPYGNDAGFDFETDDPFAIPPPLNDSILEDEPLPRPTAKLADNEVVNPQDNIDDDTTQDTTENKKKRVFKPRVNLNEERLCSKKGIEALKNLCSDVQFKGKGHEASDLNKLLHRFEHWAQCLMPRWPFDNVVQKCEVLGSKSRVKNELRRIRNAEDEIMRGELEDEVEPTVGALAGQGDAPSEENPTEVTPQQDVPQEERYVDQITDEQRERIRKNRELAFERREAKRRRLEEIQTQSQVHGPLINAGLENNQENVSSDPPSFAPDEAKKDEMVVDWPEEICHQGIIPTSGTATVSSDNVHSENDEVSAIQSVYKGPMTNGERNVFMENLDSEDAEVNDIPQPESDVKSNISVKDESSQTPNIKNEKSQVENNDDSDSEILSRSMFDINPASPHTSLPVHTNDTNNEPKLHCDAVLEKQTHSSKIDGNAALLQNNTEMVSLNLNNAGADRNTLSLATENVNLQNESSCAISSKKVVMDEMSI